MKYSSVLILLLIVFSGCTKELKVDFGEPSKKIVLYPIVTNNKKIVVKMSGAAGILSNSFPVLDKPTVVIADNNIPVDTVTIDKKGNGYSKITPVPEHEYTFIATATGYPAAMCTVKLPGPVVELTIDTSYLYFRYDRKMRARLKIKDDPLTSNYYKITVKVKDYNTTRKYRRIDGIYVAYDSSYTSLSNSFQIYASIPETGFFFQQGLNRYFLAQHEVSFSDESVFRTKLGSETLYSGSEFYFPDELFNGSEFIVDLFLGSGACYSGSPARFMFELSSISEDYYLGIKSYSKYGTKENANLPVSEEVRIYSSIEGGYGFPLSSNTVIDSSFWLSAKRPY